ncbi:hypothetical protein DVH05_008752 [Phytophthora capsici]|nr:hypothetical protein DVH05_003069 [Phytophthora capsici]KAG1711500.1 hypothetical protein DVH05_008752 [Phytophthora capsici]
MIDYEWNPFKVKVAHFSLFLSQFTMKSSKIHPKEAPTSAFKARIKSQLPPVTKTEEDRDSKPPTTTAHLMETISIHWCNALSNACILPTTSHLSRTHES